MQMFTFRGLSSLLLSIPNAVCHPYTRRADGNPLKNLNSVSLRQPGRNSSRQAFAPISALSSDKCERSLSVAARNSLYFVGCRAALKLAWPGCRKCREQLIDPGFILADRCNFSYCGSEFYDLVRSALIRAFELTYLDQHCWVYGC